jgi:hypothetical protein
MATATATATAETVHCKPCGCDVSLDVYDANWEMCVDCTDDLIADCHSCGSYYLYAEGNGYNCPDCVVNPFSRKACTTTHSDIAWVDWADFAESTRDVDFGCKFDCDGNCSGTRQNMWGGIDNKRGCCSDCASHLGYLDYLPAEATEEVKALFDDDKGFWRPGGCTLPAKYRSLICLTYHCGTDEQTDNADDKGLKRVALNYRLIRSRDALTHYKSMGDEKSIESEHCRLSRLRVELDDLDYADDSAPCVAMVG